MFFYKLLLDSIAAGMCIALGGFASVGLPKPFNGIVFSAGLVMIILMQLQLFTGNILRAKDGFTKDVILKYWLFVYIGNFIGCFLTAKIILFSGFDLSQTVNIAQTKANLHFMEALYRGIFCNVLVCIAVFLGKRVPTVTAGKVLVIMIPVTLFVISGFEHSIANMFYFSVGNTSYLNLIPVTIGNIIGGLIVVLFTKDKYFEEDEIKYIPVVDNNKTSNKESYINK